MSTVKAVQRAYENNSCSLKKVLTVQQIEINFTFSILTPCNLFVMIYETLRSKLL